MATKDDTAELDQSAEAISTPVIVGSDRFFNRELSWLQFNRRVLEEALRERTPLLERVKFLAIFSTNLDEFFMVRVSGIHEQITAGVAERTPDGLLPTEQLMQIKQVVDELVDVQHRCWNELLLPQLRDTGIRVCDYAELDEKQREQAQQIFLDEIFPVLTPLAFDPGHPFPHISNLSLNLAVVVKHGSQGERFARVKVPEVLPRLIELPTEGGDVVLLWLEQLIAAHIDTLFAGTEVVAAYPFRVTRDADVEIQEEEAADLLRTIETGLRRRHFGQVVRLAVDETMPQDVLDLLIDNLDLAATDVYRIQGSLGLSGLFGIYGLERPDLKDPSFIPRLPPDLVRAESIWAAIQHGDILLHHPFESFVPIVDLIHAAAEDPQVLAIKQTLYRVGRDTPIVAALRQARENGKQVTVLVELKARFDEENNIEWAKQLEQVGVHVVYGLLGLKTHGKILLIVRKEGDVLRRYVHLSTGNYNATTAHVYTDIGMMTCDPLFGADASDLFNSLTGYSAEHHYRRFAVAPVNLRQTLLSLIEREVEHHRRSGDGKLIFKMNTLTDPGMIEQLYYAAGEGVAIELIVRGVCCLRPGVPGLSETIRVRSLVGRFLEHTRIYYFHNGGDEEIYLSSADLMTRNLDRRVEILFPVQQPSLLRHLRDEILSNYLRDTENTHLLQQDGTYIRPSTDLPAFDVHTFLLESTGAYRKTESL